MEAVLLGLLICPLLAPQGDRSPASVEQLIQQLDSDSPDERDAAEKELLAAGDEVEGFLAKAAEGGRPEVRARCRDLLRQIALLRKRRQFWNPKPITLSLKEETLREALEKISKMSGCPVHPGRVDPDQRVSANFEGASFFQAVETICRATHTWIRWNGTSIDLENADAPACVSHAGPLMLTAELGPAHEDGDAALNLSISWEARMRVQWYEIELESATDDQGASVSVAPPRSPAGLAHRLVYFRTRSLPGGVAQSTTSDHLDLSAASRNVPRLPSVKGKLRVYLPEEITKVRFDHPIGGRPQALGLVTASVSQLGWSDRGRAGWETSLSLDLTGVPAWKHSALFSHLLTSRIQFVDPDGKRYELDHAGASSSGNPADALQKVATSLWTDKLPENRAPVALEATLVTDVWEKTFSFEFKNVERPKARK